ncbi:hypothetical protein SAZ11_58145 [Streptomyces sp. FXJ1.4098]|nr:hypothetical protein [Streptomyces sp. FXJ1.4098]
MRWTAPSSPPTASAYAQGRPKVRTSPPDQLRALVDEQILILMETAP